MTGTILEIAITLALIIANGLFSGSEIAVVSARRSRLQRRADTGNHGAREALELAEHPDRFLATVQVGITLISTLAAAFGGARISEALAGGLRGIPALAPVADTLAFVLVVGLITYFSLVLGELVPKRYALRHADGLAARVAPFMAGLSRFASPVIALLSASSNIVLRLLGQRGSGEMPITEEDILYLTNEGTSSGTVAVSEAQFIRRAFRFTDRVVRQIMTPRAEIVAVDATGPVAEAIQRILASGYSRVPLYAQTLDDVLGILHVKDLLRAREQIASDEEINLRALARPAIFVLEHQRAADILPLLQRQGAHMTLVSDEYGQVTGLLTLEDVLEELVGEITDEYDIGEARDQHAVIRRPDGTWLVDGAEAYESVREQVGGLLPPVPDEERGEYTSLAGIVLARMGRIPAAGESVRVGGAVLEVLDMDGRRIDKVLIRPSPEADGTEGTSGASSGGEV